MIKNHSGTAPVKNGIEKSTTSPVRFLSTAVSMALACAGLFVTTMASAGTFPAELQLSGLLPANGGDGSVGTIINGIAADDRSGSAVSAGDINGDGIDDLIIGAHQASPGGLFRAGESYVVFGNSLGGLPEFDLSTLKTINGGTGAAGFVLLGIAPGDGSGMSISAGADVNGDGIDDLVIGADLADAGTSVDAGEAYVIFGSNTGFPAEIALSSLFVANRGDGSVGFVINGIDTADSAGVMGRGGDFNNDMIDDLIIGARKADPGGRNNAGETYVVFGSNTGFAAEFDLSGLEQGNGGDGSTGFILAGVDPFDESGTSVGNAGDINNDGIDDMVISAPEANANGRPFAGEVYVVFGNSSFPAQVNLSTLAGGDGSTGFVVYGEATNTLTGRSASGAGDVNNDGIDDLIIGAGLAGGGAGRAYVLFGRDTAFPATFDLAALSAANRGEGSDGFVMQGIASGDGTGRVVRELGDINNDGKDDFAVGAFLASPGGVTVAGTTYAIFGRDGGFPAEMDLSSLLVANGGTGEMGFAIHGIDEFDGAGVSISAAGDVNSDGIDDMIIGAAGAEPGDRGESYVIYGQQAPLIEDTDEDGVADIDDNCPAVANADQLDGDGDDVGDLCDNCILVMNTNQRDTDGDNTGNACDPDVDVTNNCVVNFLDLNVYRANFFQAGDFDTDNNGDGQTNFVDLNVIRAYFFQPPGLSAAGCNVPE